MEARAAASGSPGHGQPSQPQIAQARAAYWEAKEHKRKAEFHKRAQRRAMKRFDKFRADLEAMGIQVVLEPTIPRSPIPPRRTSDGSDQGP